MRRVVSSARIELPWRNHFRAVGRATQVMLTRLMPGFETQNLNTSVIDVRDAVRNLCANPAFSHVCRFCSCSKQPLELCVSDASACFEQASPELVLQGLEILVARARARGYCGVSVQVRGRLVGYLVRSLHPRSDGTKTFTFQEIQAIHCLSLQMRLVQIGNCLFQQAEGVPIGGLLSKVHVSLALCPFEEAWCSAWSLCFPGENVKHVIGRVRYIDDVVSVSYQACSNCQFLHVNSSMPISFEKETTDPSSVPWLDVCLRTCSSSPFVQIDIASPKSRLLPYFGYPPADARSRIRGVQARFRAVYLHLGHSRRSLFLHLNSWSMAGYPAHLIKSLWCKHLDDVHLMKYVREWQAP